MNILHLWRSRNRTIRSTTVIVSSIEADKCTGATREKSGHSYSVSVQVVRVVTGYWLVVVAPWAGVRSLLYLADAA